MKVTEEVSRNVVTQKLTLSESLPLVSFNLWKTEKSYLLLYNLIDKVLKFLIQRH